MIVPVTTVSRLTVHALSEALSLSDDVVAVTVVMGEGRKPETEARALERKWAEWDPGIELRILRTEYSSVVDPIVSFINELLARGDKQVVVLIPVVIPDRLRYRLLHNQIDVVLSATLARRPDVVVARVQVPLSELASEVGGKAPVGAVEEKAPFSGLGRKSPRRMSVAAKRAVHPVCLPGRHRKRSRP